MNPEERAERLFRDSFGAAPSAFAAAPGHVNLIGEHVDYHGGHVLPLATPMRTAVAVGPAPGFAAVSESGLKVESDWPPQKSGSWCDYVAGVVRLMPPAAGGVAVAVAGDVPLGAGLSSSAALEVATARALARWQLLDPDGHRLADVAWRAETGFVGMPCGRMDQLAAALAAPDSALLINCRTLETRPVPAGIDVVIVPSGEAHELRNSGYAERRREGDAALARLRAEYPAIEWLVDIPPARLAALLPLLDAPLDRRVRHVVNENQRTLLAARALEAGDLDAFGALVNQSHDSLRDLYECSTPALDAIVERARGTPGVLGARLVGAGWGGTVLVVARPGDGARVAEAVGGSWLKG